ncbi:NCS2 family permease [Candidatus Sumerlaeota bacterium]|nr:NCS2 family permease [Candidatus Sumerlaeota bacterium]
MNTSADPHAGLFDLKGHGTNVKTEIIAGVTTFMTMAYIIFVNVLILSVAIGQDDETRLSLATATCLSAAFASLIMGLWANYPIGLAPGMGINSFFVLTCTAMGVPWQTTLGAVFWAGVFFIILSFFRVREAILSAVPSSLKSAIAAGIGLLIAYIGLRLGGFLAAAPAASGDLTQLGPMHTTPAALSLWVAVFGLIVTGTLLAWRVTGAILWGIILATVFHHLLTWGITGATPHIDIIAAPSFTLFGKLDIWGAWTLGAIEAMLIFFYIDLFDTVGTLIGVAKEGNLLDEKGELPRANRALLSDAIGSVFGAIMGTSTVTSYIESTAGIATGGRTGLTAVTVGVLFALAAFFGPLAGLVPGSATAPALIIVGIMMMRQVRELDWNDWPHLLAAFIVILIIPFTNAIHTGIAFGFIAFPVLMLLSGRGRQVSALIYILGALFLARYLWLPIPTEPESPEPEAPAAEVVSQG